MLSVDKLIPGGRGLSAVLLRRAAEVALDWTARHEGRFEAEDSTGRRIAASLPHGAPLRGGDVLVAGDGSLLRVTAVSQPVLAVRPREGGSPLDLLRAAYELGSRHVAIEMAPDRLRLAADPALADLLRRMGLAVSEELAPFEPEEGACGAGASGHEHGHGHGHGHGHDHGHAGACTHAHAGHAAPQPAGHAAPSTPHVHGPGCGHRHAHG